VLSEGVQIIERSANTPRMGTRESASRNETQPLPPFSLGIVPAAFRLIAMAFSANGISTPMCFCTVVTRLRSPSDDPAGPVARLAETPPDLCGTDAFVPEI
jgi:hypothetical protein